MGPISAKEIPPATKYDECLRRCPRCKLGATNAKNPAKVKYFHSDQPPGTPPQEIKPRGVLLQEAQSQEIQPQETPSEKPAPQEPKPQEPELQETPPEEPTPPKP